MDEAAIAGLAYALQDSENTSKLAELSEKDRNEYFRRAVIVMDWLNQYGWRIVRSDDNG